MPCPRVAEGSKRTWGNLWNYSVASGKLYLAISGVILLTFMTINPFQYRFSDTQVYQIRALEYLGERMSASYRGSSIVENSGTHR